MHPIIMVLMTVAEPVARAVSKTKIIKKLAEAAENNTGIPVADIAGEVGYFLFGYDVEEGINQ